MSYKLLENGKDAVIKSASDPYWRTNTFDTEKECKQYAERWLGMFNDPQKVQALEIREKFYWWEDSYIQIITEEVK